MHTVVRIHNEIWVRMSYNLVHGKNVLQKHGSRPRPNPLYPPIRLHGPVNQKTTISNLNVWFFFFVLHHVITTLLPTHIRQYMYLIVLHHTLPEQKCVRANVMRNVKVFCLTSVFNWFVTFVVFTISVVSLYMVGVI